MSTEVKPICFIQYKPDAFNGAGSPSISVYDMNKVMQDKFADYLVLCMPEPEMVMNMNLQVFHPKNFSDMQYGELKKMIEKAISDLKVTNQ